MARELGINTYSYIWTEPAAACVRRLAKLGYRQFEFLLQPPHLSFDDFGPAQRRDLRSVLQDAGAHRTAINLPSLDHNLASPFARARAAAVTMFEDTIDLAADIGAETVVVVPGRMSPLFPPSVPDRAAWVGDGIAKLLPRAADRGITLAIENVPFAAFPDAIALERFVRGFTSPTIGVCYDAANAHFIGESPADGIRRLAELIRIIHLSDTGRDTWRHAPIGTGDVPFAEVAKALDAIGYAGSVTLEVLDPDPDAAILRSHDALVPLGFDAPPHGSSGMSTILVTGAAGLLGRHVVRDLLAHGHIVRGLDRRRAEENIDWHIGDVTSPDLVAKAVAGVDAVMHIAAIPNIWSGDGQTIMRVNLLGTYTVLDAAEAAGIKRFVFCSSDSVAGYTVREGKMLPPHYAPLDLDHPLLATDPYAVSKVAGEDLARAYALRGMSVVALRTVFVAYPEMAGEIVTRAKDPDAYRGPMVGGPSSAGGGPLHHHIDPRDLARAFRLAVELRMPRGAFERFYLSAQVTLSPEPTLDRLRRLHGDSVRIRKPEVYATQPFAPLYDLTHAAEGLGFIAEFDQRHLLADLPAFSRN